MLNPGALRFIKKIDESNKSYIPHHMLLSHNLESSVENLNHSQSNYKNIPYKCSLPLPISEYYIPMMEDPSMKIVEKKRMWLQELKNLRILHKNLSDKLKLKEIVCRSNGTTNIPSYILKFTKLLKDDPDPYFNCNFNWYTSGSGNMCFPSSNPESIFAGIGNELYVLGFDGNRITEMNSKQSSKYICENMEPIYEVIHCQSVQKQIIGLRQRNKIHVVNCTNDSIPQFQSATVHNSPIPLTSFIVDGDANILYADVKGDIHKYDIENEYSTKIEENLRDDMKNNWSCLQMFDRSTIMQVDRSNLYIFDKRKHHSSLKLSSIPVIDCDYITSAKLNINNFSLYLGTVHNFYECDVRYLKQNNHLKKWTHGLKSPPIFIDNFNLDDNNIVSLGSQLLNETCVINNEPSFNQCCDVKFNFFEESDNEPLDKFKGELNYFPKHIPSILDTFYNSQKKGFCLDPTVNLDKRLSLARTGLNHLKYNDHIQLFHMNAAGDVFSQNIMNDAQKTVDDGDCNTMEKWTEKLTAKRFPFVVSSQINLKKIQLKLKRPSNPIIRSKESKGFVTNNRYWKRSLHELNNYSDMWANELLSIWDVKEVKQGIDNLVPPPIDTKFKIDTWLSKFQLDADDDM